ncbi:MAG: SIS domain-containing protein [Nitrospirales bacterium]|nr:SIS domain-containing protein [Nitrospirales bacterium]
MNREGIIQRFEESADVKRRFVQASILQIEVLAQAVVTAFRNEKKVLFFGNGGSAADAAHLAAEFVGRYQKKRAPLPALALTTNLSTLTSIANDYEFADIFAHQIQAHGQTGDIAIALSTSGNSPNVLRGVDVARSKGLVTIGWTGESGGALARHVEHAFLVPSLVTARIQECHMTLGHVLCELVEEELFAEIP